MIYQKQIFKKFLAMSFLLIIFNSEPLACAEYGKYREEMLLAENLLNQTKLEPAKAVYIAILSKSPRYEPAKLALGAIYTRQAEFVKAEKIFLSVVNSNKTSAAGYEKLAKNYYEWANLEPSESVVLLKNADKAIKRALKYDKYNDTIYNTYGLIQLDYEHYDAALDAFHKALDINQQNQDAYINLGLLYTRLNKFELALKQFERAINLDSQTPRPYKQMGKMFAEAQQYRQAIKYIKKGQFYDIHMNYKEHFLLGLLYEKLGNADEAIKEFTQTVLLRPDYVDAFTHMALLFESIGEIERSIEAYRSAIALNYGIMEQFISQAQQYLRTKDYLHGRPALIKILQIEPGNRYGFEGLCSMHYLMSREGELDFHQWYLDEAFLTKQLPALDTDNQIAKVSWEKFELAKNGLSKPVKERLTALSLIETTTPEDFSAKGEALFLLQDYFTANTLLMESIDKYVAHYSTENSYEEAAKHLVWFGDRLLSSHEFIASQAAYDKARDLTGNENAITGLSMVAKTLEKAEYMLDDVFTIPQTPDYNNQIISRLEEVIKYYPQSAEAHYKLSQYYARQADYDQAIKEMELFVKLQSLNPYKNAPGPAKVQKIIDKYAEIRDKKIKQEIERQIKEEEANLQKLLDDFEENIERSEDDTIEKDKPPEESETLKQ
jgi:tetratricopeptide (TPR) repeat protein